MRKKTESLTFPKDPLATMRELQELDSPFPTSVSETREKSAFPADNVSSIAQVERAFPTALRRRVKKPDTPLQEAILKMLVTPYSTAPEEGPFTVTSVKMSSELWNRIGLAATLTGRPKQELVAEALQAYLTTLCAAYSADTAPPDKTS